MTLAQIKDALAAGKKVYWANLSYEVIRDRLGQYFIYRTANDNAIGLTWKDNTTLNGALSEFFVA